MIISEDITERARAEEVRKELTEKLENARRMESLGVLAGGFGFSYLLRKRRLEQVTPEDSLLQGRHKLLVDLARLDDDFESGEITEEVYRRLRAERKAQLVELMQRSKEESDNR